MTATRAGAPTLAWLLTALSCLLIGIAFVESRRQTVAALPAGAADAAANRAVVEAFYEAINAVIATGEPTPLDTVLAPDYAESDASGVHVPGRIPLERYLIALHETAPNLRLVAAVLAADGDRVVALVRAIGVADPATAFPDLPLDDPSPWGAVDVFWVVDGRVAERASAAEPGVLLQSMLTAPVELGPRVERMVTVQRVTLPPGGWRRASTVPGFRLLYVEAGALAINVVDDPTQPASLPAADAHPILPQGELIAQEIGAAYAVRNLGPVPALLLEVVAAVLPASTAGGEMPWHAASAAGVSARTLAGSAHTAIAGAAGPAVLAVGRATLAPGARLGWPGPRGVVLLAVEAGTLRLTTEGGLAWVHLPAERMAHPQRQEMLASGDGALLGAGAGVEVRNAGDTPVKVLVVTLLGAPGEPAAAA